MGQRLLAVTNMTSQCTDPFSASPGDFSCWSLPLWVISPPHLRPPGSFRDRHGKPEGPWNKFHCSGLYGMIGNAVVFLCRSPFYLRHMSGLLLNSRCVPIAAGVCGFIALSRPTPAGTSSVYSVAPSARNRKLSWSNTNRSPCCDPVCRYRRTIWTPQLF